MLGSCLIFIAFGGIIWLEQREISVKAAAKKDLD
jgi:hypothetical protein